MDTEPGASHVFRELADVLETFETASTGITVTQATPVNENLLDTETVAVKVGARVPFLDDGMITDNGEPPDISVTPANVSLERDGSLHVELQVTAQYGETSETINESPASEPEHPVEPESRPTQTEASEEQTGGDPSPKPTATTESTTTDKRHADHTGTASNAETARPTSEDADAAQETVSPEQVDADPDTERPPYRDPTRLQEVYDEYETFAEMTEALDVDVTPQTVRRYMIKHDIHTPASETGSHSAELLLKMDPDSISQQATNGTEEDETTHPNQRQTPIFQKST